MSKDIVSQTLKFVMQTREWYCFFLLLFIIFCAYTGNVLFFSCSFCRHGNGTVLPVHIHNFLCRHGYGTVFPVLIYNIVCRHGYCTVFPVRHADTGMVLFFLFLYIISCADTGIVLFFLFVMLTREWYGFSCSYT